MVKEDPVEKLEEFIGKIHEVGKPPDSKDYAAYLQSIKAKVSKNHNELIEILRNEEKISREIQENKS